jgi:hypothetical protein
MSGASNRLLQIPHQWITSAFALDITFRHQRINKNIRKVDNKKRKTLYVPKRRISIRSIGRKRARVETKPIIEFQVILLWFFLGMAVLFR